MGNTWSQPQHERPPLTEQELHWVSKLGDQKEWTETELKATLREKSQSFDALNAKQSHVVSRHILKHLKDQGKTWDKPGPGGRLKDPPPVLFSWDRLDKLDRSHVKYIQDRRRDHATETWIIDTEFCTLSRVGPAAVSIGIYDLEGKLILSTNIDYNMTKANFLRAVKPYRVKRAAGNRDMASNTFDKHYRASRTNGMTILQIQSALLAKGYQSSHTVLSWCSNIDIQIFEHIMSATKDDLIHPRRDSPNTFNVYRLVKKLLPQVPFDDPNVGVTLSNLHSRLFPGSRLHYHSADDDAFAFYQIIIKIIQFSVDRRHRSG